jgi:hypothetical protein
MQEQTTEAKAGHDKALVSDEVAQIVDGGGVVLRAEHAEQAMSVGGANQSFTDNGGRVLAIAHVQLIFWGGAWGTNPPPSPSVDQITNAVASILSGGYMADLAQYRSIGFGFIAGKTVVTNTNPQNNFTDIQVANLISGLLSAGTLPGPDVDNQTLYCVFMPQGVNSQNAGTIGEHTYYTNASRNIPFAWITNNGTLSSVTSIFSHELVEACTDPEGSAITGTPGTCSQGGWCEIGDVCYSTYVLNGITVQRYWSQNAGGCIQGQFPARTYPICGMQWRGSVPANSTRRWFTFNWLAYEHTVWTVMPTTVRPGAPELTWSVQIERAAGAYVTYWISVTNLTSVPVDFEGRFCILGR